MVRKILGGGKRDELAGKEKEWQKRKKRVMKYYRKKEVTVALELQ